MNRERKMNRMNDLISKASVCEILADIYPTDGEIVVVVKEIDKAYETILNLPSAERRGRWLKGDEMADYPRVPYKPWETYCSCCREIKEQSNDNFCGNCGAKMDEDEK